MSSLMQKPLLMAGAVVAIDRFVLKQTNLNNSLYFGVAGAIGVYTAGMVATMVPLPLPSGTYFDGKTLELRILEITIGSGVAYGINRFVLKNDFNKNDMMLKVGVIAVADVISELADDYLSSRPLSFFK